MIFEEAMRDEVMPLVAIVELKRSGVTCHIDWPHNCLRVRDDFTRNGVLDYEWQTWKFNERGKIHGSRVLRFLNF